MKRIQAILFVLLFASSFNGFAQEDDPCSGAPVYLPVTPTCIMDTVFVGNQLWTKSSQFSGCTSLNNPDVWYEVIVPAAINTLIFEVNCSYGPTPIGQSIFAVYHGSCPAGPFSSPGCIYALGPLYTGSLTLSGLNPGDTLFLRLTLAGSIHGTFGMCIHPPVVAGISEIQSQKGSCYYMAESKELVIESTVAGQAEVLVYNELGQAYLKRKLLLDGMAKISLAEMPAGLYFSVVHAKGKTMTAKIFIP
jgi:hypothetical protein